MDLFAVMPPQGWFTIAIVALLFVALLRNLGPPDMLFLGAAALLVVGGVITTDEAFAGFSNQGMLTVGVLFVVAAALRETGVLDYLGHHVLGRSSTMSSVMIRLAGIVMPMSAFLNNTPIVAMFLPVVLDWSRRHQISPSKILIPLSYLAILGGTCTLIGTSTNLVINGMMIDNGMPGLHLFELALVGIPYALIGLVYLLIAGRFLPDRKELLEQLGDSRREYLAEMQVQPGCRLVGNTVQDAGLRQLPGLFLIEIERDDQIIGPVGPEQRLQVHDRLVFTGIVNSIIELEKIAGLLPVADPDYEVSPKQQRGRRLCEAVISESSPLIGKSIREADFRATYGAAVVAVHRGAHRVEKKVGDIRLRPGDTLLLQTPSHFLRAHRHDRAFYLISDVDEWKPIRRDRAGIAFAVFLIVILLMTTGLVPTVVAATLGAFAMVAMGCISPGEARNSIHWHVLVTIAAAFGVGMAMEKSGAATAIASGLVDWTEPLGPLAALAAIYFLGSFFTEMITNNAAAVLLFPFATETARLCDADPKPFLIALILSASASFMSPIGYQTNMMVYGPGGYRFSDFLKFGAPLNLILAATAITLIPRIWPF